LTCTVFMYI